MNHWSLGDGSVVKTAECVLLLHRTLIQFTEPMWGGSQPPETPASWNLVPSLASVGTELIYVHTYTQTHTHKHVIKSKSLRY